MEDGQDGHDQQFTSDSGSPKVTGAGNATATSSDAPDVTAARSANVKQWVEKIKAAKEFHDPAFKRMKKCQTIATRGADKDWPENNYTVPILGRHINVSVAALYARDPTAVAKRAKKLMFKLWDGNWASLQQAMQAAQPRVDPASGMAMPGDPNAMALLQEAQQVHQQNVQMDRMGQTLEILFQYYLSQQEANFKKQLKQLVRRVKVNSVGWLKLGFQRVMQPNPDVTAQIEDITDKIATVKQLMAEAQDGDIQPDDAEMDQLQSLLADLQGQPDLIVREGPVFGFPRSDAVIVDPACQDLKTLVGANWAAHEMPMVTAEVQKCYGIDIGGNFTPYKTAEGDARDKAEKVAQKAIVWEVQDKETQQTFTICDGYPDFLKPPASPDVRVSRFWTLFPLVFNDVEDEDELYPPSDVWTARFMQQEYNNIRQGLREHRLQNKPKYATVKGKMEDTDRAALGTAASGTVIELNSLTAGEKVDDLLQPIKTIPIDPSLYEVETIFQDMTRVIGSQEADLGQAASTTATQSSIVENGRSMTAGDNTDDIDDFLSELAHATGELMFLELDTQTVQEIVGPGAVWPSAPPTREQISKDLLLTIKAGSSGRPNRGAELANMERGLPYLLQIPGINPFPLGRRYGELLDLDVDDIVIEGMPSIIAQNTLAGRGGAPAPGGAPQPSTGNPASDPGQQGPAGALNAPNPQTNEPGPQAAHPAPMVEGVALPAYKSPNIPIGPPKSEFA